MGKLDVSAEENAKISGLGGGGYGLPVSRKKGVGDSDMICVGERYRGKKRRFTLANLGTSG